MPDAFVETAAAHWSARLVQNGVDYNDLIRTLRRIDAWSDWLPAWVETADEHAALARQAAERGRCRTEGEAWRRAAVSRHFAKFVWTVDLALAAEATTQCVTEMRSALRCLDPSAERVEADLDRGAVVATLRRPSGQQSPPLVLLVPGLDSAKEEFHLLENSFLDRGMATLSMDGPGQGETGLELPIRHDYEVAVAPLLDVVLERADVDRDRVGVCGVSLGGYYAPRVAAYESRIRALAAVSGPYDWGGLWDSLPPMTRDTFRVQSGASSDAEAAQRARALDLDGVCERITVPALYVTGEDDRIIPWQQTARQADHTAGAEFVRVPGGSHVVSNRTHVVRPLVADWMSDRLAGR